jgi:hypothetical protein
MIFDAENETLTITYTSGQTYRYLGVPEKVYKELNASRLQGRYLRFFIKDKYEFKKI